MKQTHPKYSYMIFQILRATNLFTALWILFLLSAQPLIGQNETIVTQSETTLTGKGIIDNKDSPHVKFKSINMGDCKWTDGFWADKFKIMEKEMIPYMGSLLDGDKGHALNNFKIAAGLMEGEHKGMRWHDGDFYKYMEAMMYLYAQNGDVKLLKQLDKYIEIIGAAQEEDGYLQTQAQLRDDIERYDNRRNHEMYNTGHLLTSACIHYRITGQRNFLELAIKHADLLYKYFYPEEENYARFGFNQTQIMGLVELYRTTRDQKYLELAKKFIDRRGQYPLEEDRSTKGYPVGDMVQERTPLRASTEAVGHAVLALYFYAGAADVYAETGEDELLDALDVLWENVTQQKMYVTGALGQAHYGASTNRDPIQEGFIDGYMMPNLTAYNETCANICNSMFSYRMLGIHGDGKYADIMELVLYNSMLSGINLEGNKYYYANPLRTIDGSRDYAKMNTEFPDRQGYLECFCCPPNLVRTLAKVSGWAYSLTENGIAVNLYGGNTLKTQMLDESTLSLVQETNYPWEGNVKITIQEAKLEEFDIQLRIPDWAEGSQITINGVSMKKGIIPGKYQSIVRKWKEGDVIELVFPLEPVLMEGHPRIEEVRNQVAIKRGPVVYCLESPDLPKNTSITDVYLDGNAPLKATFEPKFLGGVTRIEASLLLRKNEAKGMYRKVSKPDWKLYKGQFVPYYAWSNRGTAEMTVFVPVVW